VKSVSSMSSRLRMSFTNLGLALMLGWMAGAAILWAGYEAVAPASVHSQSALMQLGVPLAWTSWLTRMGALIGCTGVIACQFFKDGSCMRRWVFYLCASAFLISGFVLLMHWFGVSGASGWWS
jgi:hypothetical protein